MWMGELQDVLPLWDKTSLDPAAWLRFGRSKYVPILGGLEHGLRSLLLQDPRRGESC